ncbi:hypothetical protein ACFL0T_08050, partial [Candidatus Omnitrophota bacterium]
EYDLAFAKRLDAFLALYAAGPGSFFDEHRIELPEDLEIAKGAMIHAAKRAKDWDLALDIVNDTRFTKNASAGEVGESWASETGGWRRPKLLDLKRETNEPASSTFVHVAEALTYVREVVRRYCLEKRIDFNPENVIISSITNADIRAGAGSFVKRVNKKFYRTAMIFADRNDGNKVKLKLDQEFVERIMWYRDVYISLHEPQGSRTGVRVLDLAQTLIYRTVIHEIGKHAARGKEDVKRIRGIKKSEGFAESVSSGLAVYNQGARLFDRIFYEEGIVDRADFEKALRRYLDINPQLYTYIRRRSIERAALLWYDALMNIKSDEIERYRNKRRYINVWGPMPDDTKPGKAAFDTGHHDEEETAETPFVVSELPLVHMTPAGEFGLELERVTVAANATMLFEAWGKGEASRDDVLAMVRDCEMLGGHDIYQSLLGLRQLAHLGEDNQLEGAAEGAMKLAHARDLLEYAKTRTLPDPGKAAVVGELLSLIVQDIRRDEAEQLLLEHLAIYTDQHFLETGAAEVLANALNPRMAIRLEQVALEDEKLRQLIGEVIPLLSLYSGSPIILLPQPDVVRVSSVSRADSVTVKLIDTQA